MLLRNPALYTDFYELTMAQGYFLSGRTDECASFDYFFRKAPFEGGYVVFAGLSDLLPLLEHFKVTEQELQYLRSQGFSELFLEYLSNFRFNGSLFSVREGEIVFPNTPILRVEGSLIETQIIETLLLNTLNFESLVATKASRIRSVAGKRTVLDFGLRRSQGLGGIQASKASIIGGLNGTSNVCAAKNFSLHVSGTMAHSWIQSFDDELTAFRTYAKHYPDESVLLVDTYDTLNSGVPNAIKVAKELERNGHRLKAIRLDSGDLAFLAKKARKQLNDAGLTYVEIAASNQLDEYLIKSLNEQQAPIDIFGVGTKLVTAYDHPALDGVYKLNAVQHKPTLKVSENPEKITLPGPKKVLRLSNSVDMFAGDVIALAHEEEIEEFQHPYFPDKKTSVSPYQKEELLAQVMNKGNILGSVSTPQEAASYAQSRLKRLSAEHQRFENPHIYKVGITPKLAALRDSLLNLKKR